MNKIVSIDAETNGLYGKAFSIGAVVIEDGWETDRFVGRCPIDGDVNPWVAGNVLPRMIHIEEDFEDYESMLKDFISFYMKHKENSDVIVHMGVPVEARLFIDARNLGFIGDFDGPYPLIDISAFPEIGVSVDEYNKENNIDVPYSEYGGTHNPLYDSRAAALAYAHYKGEPFTYRKTEKEILQKWGHTPIVVTPRSYNPWTKKTTFGDSMKMIVAEAYKFNAGTYRYDKNKYVIMDYNEDMGCKISLNLG